MMVSEWLRRPSTLPLAVAIMAILIITVGGTIRIYDAGESCPDWPQCFGTWGFDISESVIFYGEFFGSLPIDSGSNSHGFNWGFTWAAKNNLQLDIFAGKSLNDPATDFFVNVGLSMRFPE